MEQTIKKIPNVKQEFFRVQVEKNGKYGEEAAIVICKKLTLSGDQELNFSLLSACFLQLLGVVGYIATPRGLRCLDTVWINHLSEQLNRF